MEAIIAKNLNFYKNIYNLGLVSLRDSVQDEISMQFASWDFGHVGFIHESLSSCHYTGPTTLIYLEIISDVICLKCNI